MLNSKGSLMKFNILIIFGYKLNNNELNNMS